MRRMYAIALVIGGIIVLGLGAGWFACMGWRSVAAHVRDDFSSAAAIDEIRITGGSVWVEVRAAGEPGVQVHRDVSTLNPFAGRPAPSVRVVGSVLELGDVPGAFRATSYVVRAPAGIRVTADIGTGNLDLRGVSSVDAHVGTGAVEVIDGSGDLAARVGTGQISATNLRSHAVVATTGTGAILLDLAEPADVQATSSTGSVDLKVPPASYRIDASSKLGKVALGIPSDPSGRYHLALRADTGQVTLATR